MRSDKVLARIGPAAGDSRKRAARLQTQATSSAAATAKIFREPFRVGGRWGIYAGLHQDQGTAMLGSDLAARLPSQTECPSLAWNWQSGGAMRRQEPTDVIDHHLQTPGLTWACHMVINPGGGSFDTPAPMHTSRDWCAGHSAPVKSSRIFLQASLRTHPSSFARSRNKTRA